MIVKKATDPKPSLTPVEVTFSVEEVEALLRCYPTRGSHSHQIGSHGNNMQTLADKVRELFNL